MAQPMIRAASTDECPVDREAVRKVYDLLFNKSPLPVRSMLIHHLQFAVCNLKQHSILFQRHVLSVLVIVLEIPTLTEPEVNHFLMPPLCAYMAVMKSAWYETLERWLAAYTKEEFKRMVIVFQQYITMRCFTSTRMAINQDREIIHATQSFRIVYNANDICKSVDLAEFYNDAVTEQFDFGIDFPSWRAHRFSFCDYPFILHAAKKAEILNMENNMHMRNELQDVFFRSLFFGADTPYLHLEIRRDHIIHDALHQLDAHPPGNFKKQLRVHFIGEEGVDQGGVQNEFFQLVVREIFDPKYGMFKYDEESRLHWFTSNPNEDEFALDEYRLIGLVIGLAIYNSDILGIQFPLALYRKLMDRPVDLGDLAQLHPTVGRSLSAVLSFDGDVKETLCHTFEIQMEVFGQMQSYSLKPGGSAMDVTDANRKEFVDLYVDFVLNKAIARQFRAFKRGFDAVCDNTSLRYLFRPEELELLICGESHLDFDELEKSATYDNGYSRDTPVIRWFWDIVKTEFDDEQRKKLLFFATGNDRAPIGGLSRLKFVLARNGPDTDRLPTASTCFNVLLLNEYSSKAKLRNRLLTAIQNAEGFGMQ